MVNNFLLIEEIDKNEIMVMPNTEVPSLLVLYKKTITESLLAAFLLDKTLINDRHGGDVDTIYNVRKQQNGDTKFDGYANKTNERAYECNLKDYKKQSNKYRNHLNYNNKNKHASIQKEEGTLIDAYSGKKIKRNEKVDLDHVISVKEIQEDAGRILAGVDGVELANADSNLKHTKSSINRSKKQKTTTEFAQKLSDTQAERSKSIQELKSIKELSIKQQKELDKLQKINEVDSKKMLEIDKNARADYEKKVNTAYYTGQKFMTDTATASLKTGTQMGARQALGLILTEIWVVVSEELPQIFKRKFSVTEFLDHVKTTFLNAVEAVKRKRKEIVAKFFVGSWSGVLSSLTTTVINIFATTSKSVVKIIRESWASILEALRILFVNPDKLPFGEVIRATAKVISMAVAVTLGTVVAEALNKTPIVGIPIVGEVVSTFLSLVTTGIASVTLLHFIDHSPTVQKVVNLLNSFKSKIDYTLDYYRDIHQYLIKYVAELERIPIEVLQKQAEEVATLSQNIEMATTVEGVNAQLLTYIQSNNVQMEYDGTVEGLDSFMEDEDMELHFL